MAISFLRNQTVERAGKASRFAELSVVSLAHEIDADGRKLPAGALGVVVHAYSDGIGYEVEFNEPFHAVVTLESTDLRL